MESKTLIFYVIPYRATLPKTVKFPCVRLVTDDWNDTGYQTTFHAHFHTDREAFVTLGVLKILEKGKKQTVLPSHFEKLDDSVFCSLGESLDYYRHVKGIKEIGYREILDPLNDVALNPGVTERFENEDGFKKSLLRFSEAEKAYREARKVFGKGLQKSEFKFTFTCRVEGAGADHVVDFNFGASAGLPNRIAALVGKNGTGKTQVLAHLATTLSGLQEFGNVTPVRPPFSRVLAVSYSAFDRFVKPGDQRTFSYKYFGITEDQKLLEPGVFALRLQEAYQQIEKQNRQVKWDKIMKGIIQEEIVDELGESLFARRKINLVSPNGNSLLSSGHSFLILVLTQVIAYIREESLLLYDEPEMHLHPNAVANLTRSLHRLLDEFDSYAVLATHSPVILQEIPGQHVRVFYREGDQPIVKRLPIESFGENLSTITETVFDTISVEGTYKEVLASLRKALPYKRVLKLFDERLGLNARSYLQSLYLKRKK